jgi:hypothetical protein
MVEILLQGNKEEEPVQFFICDDDWRVSDGGVKMRVYSS